MILRALCPTEPGEIEVLGEEGSFWDELRAACGEAAEGRAGGVGGDRGSPAGGLRGASSRIAEGRASPGSRATSSPAARPCSSRSPTFRAGGLGSRPSWRGSATGRCRSSPGRRSPRTPSSRASFAHSSPSIRRLGESLTRSSALHPEPTSPGDRPRRSSRRPPTGRRSTSARSSPRCTAPSGELSPDASPADLEAALRGAAATRAPRPSAPGCSRSSASSV